MLETCIDPEADLQAMLWGMLTSEDKDLIHKMYTLVDEMGDYNLCKILCRRLCELDSDDLTNKSNLANALLDNCKYAEAERLFRQCLEAKKTSLGKTHPNTLSSMDSLVTVFNYQGKYAEAEMLSRQCLEARKTSLGETHPTTLISIGNLAGALDSQGKYAEAEMLYRRCLEA
eukprot:10378733-Ditylum_brightwellii.AAC.1